MIRNLDDSGKLLFHVAFSVLVVIDPATLLITGQYWQSPFARVLLVVVTRSSVPVCMVVSFAGQFDMGTHHI